MDKNYNLLSEQLGTGRVVQNVSLSLHSTLRIGGRAAYFFEALNTQELISAVSLAKKLKLPVFILGGGTNLLISEAGFPGLVIKNKTGNLKILAFKGNVKGATSTVTDVFVEADSGISVNRLVRFCLDEGLSGMENFLGQPGTVGGAVYMNAHNMAKNDFFGNHIYQVKLFNGKYQQILSCTALQFGYDQSLVQKTGDIVLNAIFKLKTGDRDKLWLAGKEALFYRQKSQPQGVFSSGCIFRNIEKSDALRLATPNFTQSAGYLLDRAGLKGKRVGQAQFSPLHANFLVNLGGATASDVLKLVNSAKKTVKDQFGVTLKEEVVRL